MPTVNFYERGKKMKKILIAMVIFMLCCCTSCDATDFVYDTDCAYVEITTSMGFSKIGYAVHGKNSTYEKERQLHAIEKPIRGKVAKGDTVNVHFHCAQCGYDEIIKEAAAPIAKVFSCECSGKPGEGNMKEYIAVEVAIETEEINSESTETKVTGTKTTDTKATNAKSTEAKVTETKATNAKSAKTKVTGIKTTDK